MKRGILAIGESGNITMSEIVTDIWISEPELVKLFGVVVPTLRAAVRAVYKNGILKEYEVQKYIRLENGYNADVFGLPMIAALAFRINSFEAEQVRNAILKKTVLAKRENKHLLFAECQWHGGTKVSGMNICDGCIRKTVKYLYANLLPIKRITDNAYCC